MVSYNITNYDYDQVCRICLTNSVDLQDIFCENDNKNIANLLKNLASISVSKSDGLPQKICTLCIHQANSAHYFILKCKETDILLRQNIEIDEKQGIDGDLQIEFIGFNHDDMASSLNADIPNTTEYEITKISTENEKDDKQSKKNKSNQKTETKLTKVKKKQKKRSFICASCGQIFDKQQQLERHTRVHQSANDTNKFICEICGKELNKMNHLTVHMRTHSKSGENPKADEIRIERKQFPCAICEKNCSSRSNLAVHMRRHSGLMTNFCDICGKGYPRSTDLVIHMRKHTGEKPFACKVCDRAFARSDKLAIHMRTHTGEKPYKCNNCGRAFAQSNDLTTHRKRNVCVVKKENDTVEAKS